MLLHYDRSRDVLHAFDTDENRFLPICCLIHANISSTNRSIFRHNTNAIDGYDHLKMHGMRIIIQ